MARVTGIQNIKDVMDKYASSNADFFILKEDMETAKVRINHTDDKDLDVYIVHKVLLAGKDRYIECLGSEDKPCPFCMAGFKPTVRIFITLYDFRDKKIKIWDRGKTEIANIAALITRYGSLSAMTYEIERHGKKGDTNTTYQMFPGVASANDLEPREDVCGPDKFILQKTEAEMIALVPQIGGAAQGGYSAQGNGANNGSTGGTRKMF